MTSFRTLDGRIVSSEDRKKASDFLMQHAGEDKEFEGIILGMLTEEFFEEYSKSNKRKARLDDVIQQIEKGEDTPQMRLERNILQDNLDSALYDMLFPVVDTMHAWLKAHHTPAQSVRIVLGHFHKLLTIPEVREALYTYHATEVQE